MIEETLMKKQSTCVNLFNRVICDEAHKLKSLKILISRLIKLLKASHLILLTIILMINRSLNLIKLLDLLYKNIFVQLLNLNSSDSKNDVNMTDDIIISLSNYEETRSLIIASKLISINFESFLHLLNSVFY